MRIQVKCLRFALSGQQPVVGDHPCLDCIKDVIWNNCTSAAYCIEIIYNVPEFLKCVYDACGAPMCLCFFKCVLPPPAKGNEGNLDIVSYTFDINAKLKTFMLIMKYIF